MQPTGGGKQRRESIWSGNREVQVTRTRADVHLPEIEATADAELLTQPQDELESLDRVARGEVLGRHDRGCNATSPSTQ